MADERKTCDHIGCSCAPVGDSDYCSPHCETADDTIEVSCGCGHAECATALGTTV